MNVLPEINVLDDNNSVLQTIPSYYIPICVDYKTEKQNSESESEEQEEPINRYRPPEKSDKTKHVLRYHRTNSFAGEESRSPRFAHQEKKYGDREEIETSEVESNPEEGPRNITFRRRGGRSRELGESRNLQLAVDRGNKASYVPTAKPYQRRTENVQQPTGANRINLRERRDQRNYGAEEPADGYEEEPAGFKETSHTISRGASRGPRRQQQKSKEKKFEIEVRETNPVERKSRGKRHPTEAEEHPGERSKGAIRSPYLSPEQRNRQDVDSKFSQPKYNRDEGRNMRTRNGLTQDKELSDSSLSRSKPKRRIWEIRRSNEKKKPLREWEADEPRGDHANEDRGRRIGQYGGGHDGEVGIGYATKERKLIWQGKEEQEGRGIRGVDDREADWRQRTANRGEGGSKSRSRCKEDLGSRGQEPAGGSREVMVAGRRREGHEATRGERWGKHHGQLGEEEREFEARKRPERRALQRDQENVLKGEFVKESKTVTKISFSPKKEEANEYDSLQTISEFINLKEIIEEHSPARIESSHEKRFSLRYHPTN